MDADDEAHPSRLQLQMQYLDNDPGISLIGSWAIGASSTGKTVGIFRTPEMGEDILRVLPFRCPIIHPSIVMKREVFVRLNGYRPIFGAEDWDFLIRGSNCFRYANVPKPLLKYTIKRKKTKTILSTAQSILFLSRFQTPLWTPAFLAARYILHNMTR
jgi:hypothetical protein